MNNILIVTGEPSGDQRAADVVRQLKQKNPEVKIRAVGGVALKTAGAEIIFPIEKLAVMGFVEVIRHLPVIFQAYRVVKQALIQDKPDTVLLVDYPGFNLKIAKLAKSLGIRVVYYISPKLWAWKEGRVKQIKRYVDVMTVIFPFEVAFYQKHGITAHFVGCPFLEKVRNIENPSAARARFGIAPTATVLGLLPGSRVSEIKRLLPIMLKTAEILKLTQPGLVLLLPKAPGLSPELLAGYLKETVVPVTVTEDHTYETIRACDAVICASGTVSLEVGLLEVPQVVIYRVAMITGWIGRWLIKIPYASLCNILMRRCIVPELIQDRLTLKALVTTTEKMLGDVQTKQTMLRDYQSLKQQLIQEPSAELVDYL